MVNNYQQLTTNCDDHEWSTIINNYRQLGFRHRHAGGIKRDDGEQTDAERQAKKRLGVESAEHRTPTMRRNTAEIEG